ncbi:MAG: hypothetical protein ACREQY_09890, partial [Candidatus Binatia bacterium]
MEFVAAGIREDFPGLEGIVHLNSASMGVPPHAALEAVGRRLRLLERGPAGRPGAAYVEDFEQGVELARREAAR